MSKEPIKTPEPEKVFDPEVARARYQSWFPALTAVEIDKLLVYQTELIKFNKAVNLVSPATLPRAEALHFADAIFASDLIKSQLKIDAPLYDFGSGNGFPGLVIAILQPNVNVVLVDRDERKLEFCKHVASALKLKNLTVLIKDVEQLPEKSIMNVVSRGFAPLSKAMILSRRSVARGGKFFHLKGDGWANELAAVPSQLFSYWSPALLGQYKLPDNNGDMAVVITEKTAD